MLTSTFDSGKSESITISNDKGRLSKEDIERMIREGDEFAEQVSQINYSCHYCRN